MAQAKKEELVAKATELGIQLTGEEKNAEIQEAIDIKLEENAKAGNGGSDKSDNTPKKKSGKVYFYHVKVKAFKNDTERVDIGVYQTDQLVERFEKMSDEYVERYDEEIPLLDLHKISEKYRVAVYEKGGKKARPSEDILKELVKEL